MSSSALTIDEIVQTLKRSLLPTVLVEGPDDIRIYRSFEDLLGSLNANFLPCGGRSSLLSVFQRRMEFGHIPTCFVADQDMWLFLGVPQEFSDLVTTSGYSIENDVYQDSGIERILHADEKTNHSTLIGELAKWFAFEIEECRAGRDFRSDPHLHKMVPLPGFVCSPDVLTDIGYREPKPELELEVRENYKLKLRGKLLYEVLVRFSHAPGRDAKHSYNSLIEISTMYASQGSLVVQLVEEIQRRLKTAPINRQLSFLV